MKMPVKIPVRTMAIVSALTVLLGVTASISPAVAGVSVGISVSATSLGIYQATYPELVLVPGYPVYYAPRVPANYFFYDGRYWVYQDDQWHVSDWYNGPWESVHPDDVPLFVLRVPVRYYLVPPTYFYGWALDAPPRWGYYWGPRWARHRYGWNHWNRHAIPAPAPLPAYQRSYAGHRYPGVAHQRALHKQHYRYHRREAAAHHQRPESRHAQGGSFVPRAHSPQRPAPAANALRYPSTVIPVRKPQPPQEFTRRVPPASRVTPQGNPPVPRAQPSQRRHEYTQSPFAVRTPQPISAPTGRTQRVQPGRQVRDSAPAVAGPQNRQRQAHPGSGSNSFRRHAGQHSGGMPQRNPNRGQGRR